MTGLPRAAASLLLGAALSAAPAGAQVSGSLNRTGSGARAAGMGNAFIAVSDDGTAASWNPAGLAQLRRPELSFVVNSLGRDAVLVGGRSPDGRFTYTKWADSSAFQSPDFASLAIPATLGRPVTFQVSWRRLYVLDNRLETDFRREPTPLAAGEPAVDFSQRVDAAGSVDVVSLAGAMRVTDRLSLGLSWDFWSGEWQVRDYVRETPVGGSTDFFEDVERDEISGNNFSFGLMLHYPRWRVGAVYHAPLQGPLAADVELASSKLPGGAPVESSVRAELSFPRSMGLGVSFKPEPRWTLAADATWDEWSQWTLEVPGEGGPINSQDGRPPSETATRNTLSFNTGAEWLLLGKGFRVPFRVGFSYEPQGARDPVLFTGYAIKLISVGAGYNTNAFKFDVAFQWGWLDLRISDAVAIDTRLSRLSDPFAIDIEGLREERVWRLKLSAILRINDTGKLKRTLGRIFGGG